MLQMILLIPAMLGTLVATASAQTTPEADLAGLYVCEGVSTDGQPYQGLVEVVKSHDTYELTWSFESEVVAVGIGIRSGNVLAVMHYAGVPGVIAYRIEDGPRLVGQWTVAGADGALFSETLTKAPEGIAIPVPPSPDPQPQRPHRGKPRRVIIARNESEHARM